MITNALNITADRAADCGLWRISTETGKSEKIETGYRRSWHCPG
jgi:hypothetical protein